MTIATYRRDAVLSAPPHALLLRLYDAVLQQLSQAQTALESGDRAGAGMAISRALGIVTALREALDHDVGATATPALDRLYHTVGHWLLEASRERSVIPLDQCRRVLSTLREGWEEAIRATA